MSQFRPKHPTSAAGRHRHDTSRWPLLAAAGAVFVVGLAVALAVAATGAGTTRTPASAPAASDAGEVGEVGPMGGRIIATPGTATGTATAGPVRVDNANFELGTVPLMVTVQPTWTLSNTSDEAVMLGPPKANVVKGCCPGPLELSAQTIPPHGTVTLRFPLQMHPGMDGPHDLRAVVPVPGAAQPLELRVMGNFSGMGPNMQH